MSKIDLETVKPPPACYGLVVNGQVTDVVKADIKPVGYLPIYPSNPQYYPTIEQLGDHQYAVFEDRIEETWTVQPLPNALNRAKKWKRKQIKDEGLAKMQTHYSSIANFDMAKLIRDMMLSVVPQARSLSPGIAALNAIYQAGLDAINTINAMTDARSVITYEVTWP